MPKQYPRELRERAVCLVAENVQFKVETGIPVFFADPRSPWQRAATTPRPTPPGGPDCDRTRGYLVSPYGDGQIAPPGFPAR